jgi:hypothetical protein
MDPELPTDRTELLQRVVADGDRRKRKRQVAGAGIALVLLVVGATLWPNDADDQVTVVDEPTTTTTRERRETATATSTTPTSAPTTTSTASVGGPGTATTAPGDVAPGVDEVPTTEAPPVCRNSYDPRCGPFSWDATGFVDQPAESPALTFSTPVVVAQPVRYFSNFYDPDNRDADFNCATVVFEGGRGVPGSGAGVSGEVDADGVVHLPCGTPSCAPFDPPRYGPWDPPNEGSRSPKAPIWWDVVFDEPGIHTITVDVPAVDNDCDGFDLNRSPITSVQEVEVLPG